MLEKIISGGQTGADRAALDVAVGLGIKLLEQFTESLPDPDSWDDMIELFKDTLTAAERTVANKSLH